MIPPVFLLILLVFVNRYFLGCHLRQLRGRRFDEVIGGYEPPVAVVTPMFNEGRQICRTIESLARLDYPREKLQIVVVDDCSTDDSHDRACEARRRYPDLRISVLRNPRNMGKRKSINRAVRSVEAEIVVSVDSDVRVDGQAIRKLVARFTQPDIAAVGGRVRVSNARVNWITRMQVIKYYFGYEFLKNLERCYQTVMCLSGCLTAYRRSVLLELEPILENRNLIGVPIKYGEDRFLTRQIVKAGYRTVLTLEAECWTVVPATLAGYFAQQLRWRRSNLVDYLCGLSHAWRLPPPVALHYLSLAALLVCYPLVVLDALLTQHLGALILVHLGLLACFGALYAVATRHRPEEERVHPLWFLSFGIVMPVAYLVLTPLALFTLDSGSWETRGAAGGRQGWGGNDALVQGHHAA